MIKALVKKEDVIETVTELSEIIPVEYGKHIACWLEDLQKLPKYNKMRLTTLLNRLYCWAGVGDPLFYREQHQLPPPPKAPMKDVIPRQTRKTIKDDLNHSAGKRRV